MPALKVEEPKQERGEAKPSQPIDPGKDRLHVFLQGWVQQAGTRLETTAYVVAGANPGQVRVPVSHSQLGVDQVSRDRQPGAWIPLLRHHSRRQRSVGKLLRLVIKERQRRAR